MTDIQASAVQRVMQSPALADLIAAGDVGADPVGGAFAGGWVFQSSSNEMPPFRDVKGTGTGAVVLAEREGWTSPNAHNSAHFPTLWLVIYADASREAGLTPTMMDGRARVKRIFYALDPLFHLPANDDHSWPLGLYVTSSLRQSELTMVDVISGDGTVQGIARYGLSVD